MPLLVAFCRLNNGASRTAVLKCQHPLGTPCRAGVVSNNVPLSQAPQMLLMLTVQGPQLRCMVLKIRLKTHYWKPMLSFLQLAPMGEHRNWQDPEGD